jgi:hypothetical protein
LENVRGNDGYSVISSSLTYKMPVIDAEAHRRFYILLLPQSIHTARQRSLVEAETTRDAIQTGIFDHASTHVNVGEHNAFILYSPWRLIEGEDVKFTALIPKNILPQQDTPGKNS